MARLYGVKDREGIIHPEPGRGDAAQARKAYGGMIMQSKDGGANWRRYKPHHVFLWIFLAIQVIFIIWLITGTHGNVNHLTAHSAADCRAHHNYFFNSLKDCIQGSSAATEAGTAIGFGLVVLIWVIVDFLLAVTYGIYRLARR